MTSRCCAPFRSHSSCDNRISTDSSWNSVPRALCLSPVLPPAINSHLPNIQGPQIKLPTTTDVPSHCFKSGHCITADPVTPIISIIRAIVRARRSPGESADWLAPLVDPFGPPWPPCAALWPPRHPLICHRRAAEGLRGRTRPGKGARVDDHVSGFQSWQHRHRRRGPELVWDESIQSLINIVTSEARLEPAFLFLRTELPETASSPCRKHTTCT
ncbi:hypothetical protein B0T11DRAFT_274388 [Plectosphaerella cucumerina]|uniref:Uncharacterized protein n=1 Tax=Plectosphaerella cucumerina TaxID=40658 RepID=A0A8K0TPH4_9PEZI|nr:hypothetical protein B0T11DRAFT_274388 [Plectosphaerella cucumerina]